MTELQRSIPASINYQDVLPVAVPAIARRRKFYPANGTQFSAGGTSEIRIEVGSVNSLLDCGHSYLEMLVTNNTVTTCGLDLGGTNVLFREIRVEQGGRVLAREQEHNRLHAGVLSVAQVTTQGQFTESLTSTARGNNGGGGGAVAQMTPVGVGALGSNYVNLNHSTQLQVPAFPQTIKLTMAMPTGLFTQDKLLPLPLVAQNAPITLVLVMDLPQRCGVWAAPPGNQGLRIDRISYNAQLIEVGGDVINQIRTMQDMGNGQITIASTDIEHSQGLIPNNSVGEVVVNIPIRKRSIKSILFQLNSEDLAQAAPGLAIENIFNLSYAGSANMDTYQLRVGAVTYPSTPVNCWGNTARAPAGVRPLPTEERGECLMELAKSLGSLGFTNPTGRLSGITYGVATAAAVAIGQPRLTDGDNGNGAGATLATDSADIQSVCPFGLDLDSFQHESIEAGVDSETLAQHTNLVLNFPGVGSGIEDKNLHSWLIHDQFYYFNRDGSITISN
jgi:hypothetical protein